MQATINIDNKDRVVWLDYGIAYDYELMTGRTLHTDLAGLKANYSIVILADLFYVALSVPIREKQGIVDFRPRDVARWMHQEPPVVERFLKLLDDAFAVPTNDGGEVDAGKKKKAAPIGKR
jgi:hypothetical protein